MNWVAVTHAKECKCPFCIEDEVSEHFPDCTCSFCADGGSLPPIKRTRQEIDEILSYPHKPEVEVTDNFPAISHVDEVAAAKELAGLNQVPSFMEMLEEPGSSVNPIRVAPEGASAEDAIDLTEETDEESVSTLEYYYPQGFSVAPTREEYESSPVDEDGRRHVKMWVHVRFPVHIPEPDYWSNTSSSQLHLDARYDRIVRTQNWLRLNPYSSPNVGHGLQMFGGELDELMNGVTELMDTQEPPWEPVKDDDLYELQYNA